LFQESLEAISKSIRPGGRLIGITPDKNLINKVLNSKTKFQDRLGNELELKGDRLWVKLTDGPFYKGEARSEPILDPEVLTQGLAVQGLKLIQWTPMLPVPNELVSDVYSKFVFEKSR
jgi:hypothetical protein